MRYRKLTQDYDYSFGNNELDYLDEFSSIVQAIKAKILLFYGEWWENLGIGIPLLSSILGKVNSGSLRQSTVLLVEQRIMEVEGVSSVENIDVEVTDRTIMLTASVNTEYGQAEVEVSI